MCSDSGGVQQPNGNTTNKTPCLVQLENILHCEAYRFIGEQIKLSKSGYNVSINHPIYLKVNGTYNPHKCAGKCRNLTKRGANNRKTIGSILHRSIA